MHEAKVRVGQQRRVIQPTDPETTATANSTDPSTPSTKRRSTDPRDELIRGEPTSENPFTGEGQGPTGRRSPDATPPKTRPARSAILGAPLIEVVPQRLYIGGRWIAPVKGQTFPIINPANGRVIDQCPSATREDVDLAVKSARGAFESGIWSGLSGAERAKYLTAIADKITEKKQELAELEVLNNGKPLADALGDITDVAACFSYYADRAKELDRTRNTPIDVPDASFKTSVVREPIGVAAAIIPWNYPLLMAAWKVAPALAAGCTMVLKPSELTPMTALKLAAIADEVGLPPGVLNIVPGTGRAAGEPLSTHPGIDKLAFTGGVATGRRIMEAASQNLKPVTLELGGKSPIVVFDDVDIEKALGWILFGIFGNQGEVCSATSRLVVHERIAKKLTQRLVEEARKIRVGPGMKDGVKMGPLVSKGHYEKVLAYIKKGLKEGAKLECGGGRPKGSRNGFFVEPTIFSGVREDMSIWKEEIFGPVLCIKTFRDEREAIALANNSEYGLAAAVMSEDKERCERVAQKMEAGVVWINCSQPAFVQAPWGGVKNSGIGRELGPWGLENYLRVKQITEYASDKPWQW